MAEKRKLTPEEIEKETARLMDLYIRRRVDEQRKRKYAQYYERLAQRQKKEGAA